MRNSILSRGVVVEEGASVTNSIINQSCIIKSGARVENAILDKNNVVPTNTELWHAREHPGAKQGSVNFRYHDRKLTLAPQHRS